MNHTMRMGSELPEEVEQALQAVKAKRAELIAARESMNNGMGSAQAVIKTNRQLRVTQSTLMHAMLKHYLLPEEDVTGRQTCLLCDAPMDYAYADGCCCDCMPTEEEPWTAANKEWNQQ